MFQTVLVSASFDSTPLAFKQVMYLETLALSRIHFNEMKYLLKEN